MKTYILAAFSVFAVAGLTETSSVMATAYYQSTGGTIAKSDAGTFATCGKKIFRDKGSDGLPAKLQKKLLVAKFTGATTEDLSALISQLKKQDACTYGEDGEKFN